MLPCDVKGLTTVSAKGGLEDGFGGGCVGSWGSLVGSTTSGRGLANSVLIVDKVVVMVVNEIRG